jgi:PAS domain S-box-containing protein
MKRPTEKGDATIETISPGSRKRISQVDTTQQDYPLYFTEPPPEISEKEVFWNKPAAIRGIFPGLTGHAPVNETLLSGILDASTNSILYFQCIRNIANNICDFELQYANAAAGKLAGIPTVQLLRKKYARVQNHIFDLVLHEQMAIVAQGPPMQPPVCYESPLAEGSRRKWYRKTVVKLNDGVVVTIEDVTTEKLELEREKSRSEQLRDVQGIAQVGSWDMQVKTRQISCSEEMYSIYGYAPGSAELTSGLLSEIIHPDDRENVDQLIERSVKEGEPQHFVHRICRHDGEERIISVNMLAVKDATGAIVTIHGTSQDITRIKRIEKELRSRNKIVRGILDNMPVIVTIINRKGTVLEAEGSGLRNKGWKDHRPGSNIFELHPRQKESLKQVMLGRSTMFLSEKDYRGEKKYFQNYYFFDTERGCAIGFSIDVTSRQRMEKELKTKNKLISRIFNNLPVAIFRLDNKGYVLESVGLGLRNIGLENLEVAGASIYEVYPMIRKQMAGVYKGKTATFTAAIDFIGKRRYFQNYFFYDVEKESAIGLAIDITEQKEAEARLRQEKEFSESLLDSSIDGICAFDSQGRITAWNRSMEHHCKIMRENAMGKKMSRVFPRFRKTDEASAIMQALKGKKSTLLNRAYLCRDGFFEMSVVPLFNNSREAAGGLCIIHDITERRQLEQEATALRVQQQKEIMKAILEAQEVERKRISEGLHNGVGQLLYAAKLNLEQMEPEENKSTDNSGIRKDLRLLLEEAIRETRTISFELMPNILKDFGLETALQVMMRKFLKAGFLIQCTVNGFEKRPEAGFETAVFRIVQELINNIVKHANATKASVNVHRNSERVRIIVMDNGRGFNEKELSKLRDGLGLQTIKNRVELLNGSMQVESEVGRHTLVTIEIKEQ